MEAASEIQASRHIEVRVCFVGGETQVGGPDLDQLTPNPPPGQRQMGVGTGADHYVHVGRPRRVRVRSEMPVASDRAVTVTPRRARSCFSRGPTWSGAAATAAVVSSTAQFHPAHPGSSNVCCRRGTAPPQLQTQVRGRDHRRGAAGCPLPWSCPGPAADFWWLAPEPRTMPGRAHARVPVSGRYAARRSADGRRRRGTQLRRNRHPRRRECRRPAQPVMAHTVVRFGLVAAEHRAARFMIGRHVLFEESDMRAWVKVHGIPAGRRKDADRGTGWCRWTGGGGRRVRSWVPSQR